MNALDELRQHTAKEREAKRLRDQLAAQRQLLVRAAFDQGHLGRDIAAAAGCSKERVYQLRDGGRRRRPGQTASDLPSTALVTEIPGNMTGHPLAAWARPAPAT